MDETTTEFKLLVQRTKQRIVIGERIRGSIQLFQRSSNSAEKIPGWRGVSRNFAIYEKNIQFFKNFNKQLNDPVWETVNLKIKKYVPFLNIDVFQYKKILRELVNE